MRAPSWQEMIEDARSEREVVDVTRHYLAANHFAIAQLPDECKPTRLVCGADVAGLAFALVRRQTEDDSRNHESLARVTAFFIHANAKLSDLLATSNDDEGALEDSA